jgi:hypothetical protein
VANVRDMVAALARIDRFGLDRVTDGEVPRPPGASGFVAHPEAGLLFLPVAGRSGRASARLDGRHRRCRAGRASHRHDPEGPAQMDAHAPRFREFQRRATSDAASGRGLSRPAARAIGAKRRDTGVLATRYKLRLGQDAETVDGHGPLAFAAFLKGHLKGQTSLRHAGLGHPGGASARGGAGRPASAHHPGA